MRDKKTESKSTTKESILTVTVQRNKDEATVEERVLDVHEFQTDVAMVKVHHGCTRKIEEFDYLRCDVEIIMPCYREEVPTIVQEVSDMVYSQLDKEVASAFGEDVTSTVAESTEAGEEQQEELEELTYDMLQEMDSKELIAVAKEEEVKLTAKDKKDDNLMIEKISEALGIEAPEEGAYTYSEVAEMSDAELIALAKENSVKLTAKDKKDTDVVFNKICDALGLEDPEAEGSAEGEEEGEEGEDITYGEVAELDDAALLALAKEEGVKLTAKDKKDMDIVFNKVCDHLGLEEGEEEGTEGGEEEECYTAEGLNAMTIPELLEVVDELAADEEDPIDVEVTARMKRNQASLAKVIISALDL